MQQMVSSLLKLKELPEPFDASDALAVALCHAHVSRARQRIAAATSKRPPLLAENRLSRAARLP
jgi:crossover junction endodeoxyribonuclease RuvC